MTRNNDRHDGAAAGFADPERVRQEAERRELEEQEWAPAALLPPEAFSDDEAPRRYLDRVCSAEARTGRHAEAVQQRIMSSCAGWKRRPTASEFYDAVRATRPTPRQRSIVRMWGLEATFAELIQAWAQRAYTDRQLARALRLAGFDYGPRIREINQWATKS